MVIAPKKLIEVALPLDAINAAAAREKSIRHGHPSTLHLWWARRPLAAVRAVLFGQLVNDPSWRWDVDHPGETPPPHLTATWAAARKRLFAIIEDLVKWENTTNEAVLERAREEIRKSWRETCEVNRDHPDAATLFDPAKLPALHDPFAGGGSIPLEAQRLGLEAHASDLNPVAVLINKAMIEIPPKFADRPPVHPDARKMPAPLNGWKGAAGLAEDVRRYGQWMRDEAFKRIGHLYPPVEVTAEMAADGRPDLLPYVGRKLKVIAWLWARTVRSPNPAFRHVDVPLVSTFILGSKEGKQAYVQPVIENGGYRFNVRVGHTPAEARIGTKSSRGANFRCVMSNSPIEPSYIKGEAVAGRMGARLMAIVAEGTKSRVYVSPLPEHKHVAASATPGDLTAVHLPLANDPRNLWCLQYGLTHFDNLFTARQLTVLTLLSDLVGQAREQVRYHTEVDALDAGVGLEAGGFGAKAYAEAISVYLALGVDRSADFWSALCTWANQPKNELVAHLFTKQAIPMAWDFAEANPYSGSGGSFSKNLDYVCQFPKYVSCRANGSHAKQIDAPQLSKATGRVISTDPPYYDNIGYADLSDFFYVWLRRSLRSVMPTLMLGLAVPKAEELVATPYRHGGREKAERFFLEGMTEAMRRLADQTHQATPLTIYYAFKQSETRDDAGTSSAGWVTFLEAALRSGLAITGTWPMHTERVARSTGLGTNALASCIILVCRSRSANAPTASRRQFQRELNARLPEALAEMTRGNGDGNGRSPVAPVDLSQAIIGPGMAVFSKYKAVLEADGTPMSVRTALQLINRFLAEDDFDADTQFCLHWFEQHGWEAGKFGEADTLARAKGTSVEGVRAAGVVAAGGGSVRLLRWREYPAGWDPHTDGRLPVWEALHQLIRSYHAEGDRGAGRVLAAVGGKAEPARQLAYRLYTLCERAGRAEDARAYNEVVTGWSGIESATADVPMAKQQTLFE